jgi:hypothetical protein
VDTLPWVSSRASLELGWCLTIAQTSIEGAVGLVLGSVHEQAHCLMNQIWRVCISLNDSSKVAFEAPRDSP